MKQLENYPYFAGLRDTDEKTGEPEESSARFEAVSKKSCWNDLVAKLAGAGETKEAKEGKGDEKTDEKEDEKEPRVRLWIYDEKKVEEARIAGERSCSITCALCVHPWLHCCARGAVAPCSDAQGRSG